MAQGVLITLTTGAVVVAGSGVHGVMNIVVRNRGTGTGYLGGSDVTTAGFPMTTAEDWLPLTVMVGETLYGTSTGAAVLQTLRLNSTT